MGFDWRKWEAFNNGLGGCEFQASLGYREKSFPTKGRLLKCVPLGESGGSGAGGRVVQGKSVWKY